MAARRGGGGRGFKRSHNDYGYDQQGPLSPSSAEDREPLNDRKRRPIVDERFSNRTEEFIAFDKRFVKAILSNVKVLTIGDSLMRGVYKDLITWLHTDDLTLDKDIKARSEPSYREDRQIDISLLSDDRVFRQAREYQTEQHLIQFFFTTRVMKDDMELLIQQMLGDDGYPDVIILNSMIWDLTRYFRVSTNTSYSDTTYQKEIEIEALQKFLDRTTMLLRRFRAILPPHTMVVWICFPHCRPSILTGGRGIQAAPLTDERNHFIRSVMIDGSFRVAQVVRNAGYDVLDIGFYMRNHAFYHYQKDDGMHWNPSGVRLMSQLILQFLAKSWGVDTSHYLTRLEKKQDRDSVNCAIGQMMKHDYYSSRMSLPKCVSRLQEEIARKTFAKMSNDKKEAAESIIEKARTLNPFVQPPIKTIKRVNTLASFGGQSYGNVTEIQLKPKINRQVAEEVDDLSMELLTITADRWN